MKLEKLTKLFEDLLLENPGFKPLKTKNVTSYFDLLKDVPDDAFDKAAILVRQSATRFGWPGAGEIYQACRRFWQTEPERLWKKTVDWMKTTDSGTHDEWNKINAAIKAIGGEAQLIEAEGRDLEALRIAFLRQMGQE